MSSNAASAHTHSAEPASSTTVAAAAAAPGVPELVVVRELATCPIVIIPSGDDDRPRSLLQALGQTVLATIAADAPRAGASAEVVGTPSAGEAAPVTRAGTMDAATQPPPQVEHGTAAGSNEAASDDVAQPLSAAAGSLGSGLKKFNMFLKKGITKASAAVAASASGGGSPAQAQQQLQQQQPQQQQVQPPAQQASGRAAGDAGAAPSSPTPAGIHSEPGVAGPQPHPATPARAPSDGSLPIIGSPATAAVDAATTAPSQRAPRAAPAAAFVSPYGTRARLRTIATPAAPAAPANSELMAAAAAVTHVAIAGDNEHTTDAAAAGQPPPVNSAADTAEDSVSATAPAPAAAVADAAAALTGASPGRAPFGRSQAANRRAALIAACTQRPVATTRIVREAPYPAATATAPTPGPDAQDSLTRALFAEVSRADGLGAGLHAELRQRLRMWAATAALPAGRAVAAPGAAAAGMAADARNAPRSRAGSQGEPPSAASSDATAGPPGAGQVSATAAVPPLREAAYLAHADLAALLASPVEARGDGEGDACALIARLAPVLQLDVVAAACLHAGWHNAAVAATRAAGASAPHKYGGAGAALLHKALQVAASQSDADAVVRALPTLQELAEQRQSAIGAVGGKGAVGVEGLAAAAAALEADGGDEGDDAFVPANLAHLLGYGLASAQATAGSAGLPPRLPAGGAAASAAQQRGPGGARGPPADTQTSGRTSGALVSGPARADARRPMTRLAAWHLLQARGLLPAPPCIALPHAGGATAELVPPVTVVLHHLAAIVAMVPVHAARVLACYAAAFPPAFVHEALRAHGGRHSVLASMAAGTAGDAAAAAGGLASMRPATLVATSVQALSTPARECLREYFSRTLLPAARGDAAAAGGTAAATPAWFVAAAARLHLELLLADRTPAPATLWRANPLYSAPQRKPRGSLSASAAPDLPAPATPAAPPVAALPAVAAADPVPEDDSAAIAEEDEEEEEGGDGEEGEDAFDDDPDAPARRMREWRRGRRGTSQGQNLQDATVATGQHGTSAPVLVPADSDKGRKRENVASRGPRAPRPPLALPPRRRRSQVRRLPPRSRLPHPLPALPRAQRARLLAPRAHLLVPCRQPRPPHSCCCSYWRRRTSPRRCRCLRQRQHASRARARAATSAAAAAHLPLAWMLARTRARAPARALARTVRLAVSAERRCGDTRRHWSSC
jgi:hypothetical protein